MGEVLNIDWRDRDEWWIDYIQVHIKLDVSRPIKRIVRMVGAKGKKVLCNIKYERLPIFC